MQFANDLNGAVARGCIGLCFVAGATYSDAVTGVVRRHCKAVSCSSRSQAPPLAVAPRNAAAAAELPTASCSAVLRTAYRPQGRGRGDV